MSIICSWTQNDCFLTCVPLPFQAAKYGLSFPFHEQQTSARLGGHHTCSLSVVMHFLLYSPAHQVWRWRSQHQCDGFYADFIHLFHSLLPLCACVLCALMPLVVSLVCVCMWNVSDPFPDARLRIAIFYRVFELFNNCQRAGKLPNYRHPHHIAQATTHTCLSHFIWNTILDIAQYFS